MTKEERRGDYMLNFNLDSSREARSRSPINILYAAPGGPGVTRSIVRVFLCSAAKHGRQKNGRYIYRPSYEVFSIHRRRTTEQTLELFLGLVLLCESKVSPNLDPLALQLMALCVGLTFPRF